MVEAIPKGFHSITPFFMAADPDGLVEFMKSGLGAKLISEIRGKNGKIWHAQLQIGDSMVMLGDSMGQESAPLSLYLYVKDADASYKQALASGAQSLTEPADQFYGDRNAGVKDAYGNTWWFATHVEDVSDTELQKRAREFEQKVAA